MDSKRRTDETRRAKRIESWADKQRRSRDWISFAEVAEWCARERGSIQVSTRLREDAYRELGEAIMRGEFEVNGLTRVTFRHRAVTRLKMTRKDFEDLPTDIARTYLQACWVPRAFAAQWFAARRIPLPPWVEDGKRDTARSVLVDRRGDEEAGLPDPKSRGGHPRVYDWDSFDREMMRIANSPDGLPDRPELQRQMFDWCERVWGGSPSDSKVRARIARVYPDRT